VRFAAITFCVASQRVFIIIIVIYFVVDSVRKLLDTSSYIRVNVQFVAHILLYKMKLPKHLFATYTYFSLHFLTFNQGKYVHVSFL
jgi:hypothetical protein